VANANLLPLIFTDRNLRNVCSGWAHITEYSLLTQGAQLAYKFPQREAGRQKIRLGILAKQFTPKPETFAGLPTFEHLDRDRFEIILFVANMNGNPVEQYAASRADRTIHLPAEHARIVQLVRDQDLDVLLIGTNITMSTSPLTLASMHRLARVQATGFNSPITTGIGNVDYYITGDVTEPLPDGQDHYTEKLVTLGGPGFCFSHAVEPYTATARLDRGLVGIPEEAVVFISGANCFKLVPELREAWARILARTPGSRLVLMPFSPTWSAQYPAEAFVQSMKKLLARHRVDEQRLHILEPFPNRKDLQEALKLGDIYLDSWPYSATTSLLDPLECCLPVVTRAGSTLRGRMGASMLRSLSLDDLVAEGAKEYIEIAVNLARQPRLRDSFRERIREQMSGTPQFLDSQRYAGDIGALFASLFRQWQERQPVQGR